MAPGESGTGNHGRQVGEAEALVAPCPVEGRHGLPQAVDGPPIVTLGIVGEAEVPVRQRLLDDIPPSLRNRQGAVGSGDGLVMCAYEVEMDCLKDRDLLQSTRVVEGLREGLSLAEGRQITPHIADRAERRAQSEAEIDGLL